jgi:DNA-binding response OmpR family regulator
VRVLLVEIEGRALSFATELLLGFCDALLTKTVGELDVGAALPWADVELVVIARDVWIEEDTELCRSLHAARLKPPVFAVCGACDTRQRTAALRAGADDFLSVPFDVEELVARAFALVRRASSGSRHARVGPFEVDLVRRKIVVRKQQVALTLREYDVLAALIERAGDVVTRKELETQTGASGAGTDSNVVDVHMSRIREKLGADAVYIETVRGLGYRFRRD